MSASNTSATARMRGVQPRPAAGQAVGVARPSMRSWCGAGVVREGREGRDAQQDLHGGRGGRGSAPTRRRSSLPGLSRMRLETPSLPMSCSRPHAAQGAERVGAVAELRGDAGREAGHAARVAEGVRRLRVDDLAKASVMRSRRSSSATGDVVRRESPSRAPRPRRAAARARSPSGRSSSASASRGRTSGRGARPRLGAAVDAAVVGEDLDRLREARDAGQRSGSVALQPVRLAPCRPSARRASGWPPRPPPAGRACARSRAPRSQRAGVERRPRGRGARRPGPGGQARRSGACGRGRGRRGGLRARASGRRPSSSA